MELALVHVGRTIDDDLTRVNLARHIQGQSHILGPKRGRERVCGRVGKLHRLVDSVNDGDREY